MSDAVFQQLLMRNMHPSWFIFWWFYPLQNTCIGGCLVFPPVGSLFDGHSTAELISIFLAETWFWFLNQFQTYLRLVFYFDLKWLFGCVILIWIHFICDLTQHSLYIRLGAWFNPYKHSSCLVTHLAKFGSRRHSPLVARSIPKIILPLHSVLPSQISWL